MTLLKNNTLYQTLNEYLFVWLLWVLAFIATSIVGLIIYFLISESLPFFLNNGISLLFSDATWNPTEGHYNLAPMLVGSLCIMVGAVFLAAPLGIISAIFCHYYSPPLISKFYRKMIQLLAGIPSVVFGFWGLVELVPIMREIQSPGVGLLTGIVVVALMILPTMALTVDASFSSIPKEYTNGAMALALSRATTIRKVIVPATSSAIFTGIILSAGRAIGETMAVVMVCGNIVQFPQSIFRPVRTLTANIALEMAYAMGDHRNVLFVTGLILTGVIVLLILAAEALNKGKLYA